MNKRTLMKWFVGFFGMMFLFTILSRVAASVNTVQVQTRSVSNQVVTHEVTGEGTVMGITERAIFVLEGQKVERVYVQEGEKVEKGQVLLKLAVKYLKTSIRKKQDEIATLNEKIEDLKSAASVETQKRENEQVKARQNYASAASVAEYQIQVAQNEADIARQKLKDYYMSQDFISDEEKFTDDEEKVQNNISQEDSLKEEVRTKEQAVNDAIVNRNKELLSAQQGITDTELSPASDSSLQNAQRELESAQEELDTLQKLLEKKGKVKSPCEGVIKTLNTLTGSQTGSEAAVVLYEITDALRLQAIVSKEELAYIQIGENVNIQKVDNSKVQDAVVESVKETKIDGEYLLSIKIFDETLNIGENVTFMIAQDAGPFSACIPISALHEENGKIYVYVTDQVKTILGEQLVARKLEVSVQDKNISVAALGNDSVSDTQQVIIECDRELSNGSRVRLQEE